MLRRRTRSCGQEAAGAIPFPGADSMILGPCGAISRLPVLSLLVGDACRARSPTAPPRSASAATGPTWSFQDASGAHPGRRNTLLRPRKILPFPSISGCDFGLDFAKNRGAGAKRMRRRPRTHANSRQGLPIAILSLFKGLECIDTENSGLPGRGRSVAAAGESAAGRSGPKLSSVSFLEKNKHSAQCDVRQEHFTSRSMEKFQRANPTPRRSGGRRQVGRAPPWRRCAADADRKP